jgi:hypothetical protein
LTTSDALTRSATLWSKFEADLPEDIIDSAVLISGIYDLEPLRFIETGRALNLTPELVKQGAREVGQVTDFDAKTLLHSRPMHMVRAGHFVVSSGNGDGSDGLGTWHPATRTQLELRGTWRWT